MRGSLVKLILTRGHDELQHLPHTLLGLRGVGPIQLATLAGIRQQLLTALLPNLEGPIRSSAVSTNCSGEIVPRALIRLIMKRTPGRFVFPTISAAKLIRLMSEPLLIHSFPVCQPSLAD